MALIFTYVLWLNILHLRYINR